MASIQATQSRQEQRSWLERFISGPWPWLIPAIVVLAIFRIYPIISQFWYSMTDIVIVDLSASEFVGLSNYRYILSDPGFLGAFGFTFIFTIFGVLGQWVFGFALALLLDQPLKGRWIYRICIMSAWVISSLVVGYIWRLMLSESGAGVLNSWLELLGFESIRFLSNPQNARLSVIWVNIWRSVAYSMVFMLGGLQTIPHDLLEAATVDGANAWQRLTRIKIPFMRHLIAINIVFVTISTFNVYEQVLVITNGGPGTVTETVGLKMYDTAFGNFNSGSQGLLGMGSAMGVVMFAITLVFTVVYLRLTFFTGDD